MKTPSGYIQGYNAQAVANENQVGLAAPPSRTTTTGCIQ